MQRTTYIPCIMAELLLCCVYEGLREVSPQTSDGEFTLWTAEKDMKKLFVGSLSWDTNDESLRNAFAVHGEISEAVVGCFDHLSKNTLEAHLSTIRKKVKQVGAQMPIKNKRGFGYYAGEC